MAKKQLFLVLLLVSILFISGCSTLEGLFAGNYTNISDTNYTNISDTDNTNLSTSEERVATHEDFIANQEGGMALQVKK